MKILLIGKGGQLGHDLQFTLAPLGTVVAVGRETVDLTNEAQIRQVVTASAPDAIVNAAAYTAVDKAESEPDLARAVNGFAPSLLAQEAKRLDIPLIHVSTDYVFDGRKNTPYLEDDSTYPLGAYGASKLYGEDEVRRNCDRHIIVRTAWVYGAYGKGNFVKTMLRVGKDREELRVVVDQVGCPTWTGDLAAAIAKILAKVTDPEVSSDIYGIYHYTNAGAISWYDFAVAIFEEASVLGFPLAVRQVVPIFSEEYPTPTQRPAYSVLSHKKTAALIGEMPPHWRQGLRSMLKELKQATPIAP